MHSHSGTCRDSRFPGLIKRGFLEPIYHELRVNYFFSCGSRAPQAETGSTAEPLQTQSVMRCGAGDVKKLMKIPIFESGRSIPSNETITLLLIRNDPMRGVVELRKQLCKLKTI